MIIWNKKGNLSILTCLLAEVCGPELMEGVGV